MAVAFEPSDAPGRDDYHGGYGNSIWEIGYDTVPNPQHSVDIHRTLVAPKGKSDWKLAGNAPIAPLGPDTVPVGHEQLEFRDSAIDKPSAPSTRRRRKLPMLPKQAWKISTAVASAPPDVDTTPTPALKDHGYRDLSLLPGRKAWQLSGDGMLRDSGVYYF